MLDKPTNERLEVEGLGFQMVALDGKVEHLHGETSLLEKNASNLEPLPRRVSETIQERLELLIQHVLIGEFVGIVSVVFPLCCIAV